MPSLSEILAKPFQKYILDPADYATQQASAAYPQQDWDHTPYNALRHSLWVGGMRQAMGNTTLAGLVAGGIGEANELATMIDPRNWNGKKVEDTMLDLNNNRVGLDAAARTNNREDMLKVLRDQTPMATGRASLFHSGTPSQLRYTQNR